MQRLTLNIFISLIIKSKVTGKGKIGNGKLLVRLLSIIADHENQSITKEWNILEKFSDNPVKASAYQKIDRLMLDFLSTGNRFPIEKFSVSSFEKNTSIDGKNNLKGYQKYLQEMGNFCEEILDKEKASALIFTLLEIIKCDNTITTIFYGNEFLPKENLFGTPAHPKRICIEALLLGLLYQTLKEFTPASAGDIALLHSKKLLFHLAWLGGKKNLTLWKNPDELQKILDLEISVSVKENLQIEQVRTKESYPVEILRKGKDFQPRDENTIHAQVILKYGSDEERQAFLFQPENGLYPSLFDFQQEKHIFLCGAGGMGKSFLLQHQKGLYLSLVSYRKEIRKEIFPEVSCWILVQILLKYHYQYEYETYEICSAHEGEQNLWKQISELLQIFQSSPQSNHPDYTILLDGFNEISLLQQDALANELQMICEKWHNVRVIISGRNFPFQEVFQDFEKLRIEGIPKTFRQTLLSDFPDAVKDLHLFEILTIPLFMRYFLEANHSGIQAHTKGEILDFYFENAIKKYDKSIQFTVKYAVPFLAYASDLYPIFRRSEVSDAIEKAVEIFIKRETVWQDVTAPERFRKQALLEDLQSIDFVEILIEQLGILEVVQGYQLQFSHEYIREYFTAKYVLNAVQTITICYDNKPEQKEQLIDSFMLNRNWSTLFDQPYIMIGEICGDYRNIPDENGILDYHRTELDDLLDIAREFHVNIVVENVIHVMKFTRNYLICGVDFSGLVLVGLQTSSVTFHYHGNYPCNFQNCRVWTLSKPDSDCKPYQNCDFRNCNYMGYPETKENLREMGAIVD